MLNESVQTIESSAVGTSEPPADRRAQIESAIAELRPRLQRDGGDIELIADRGRHGGGRPHRQLHRLRAGVGDAGRNPQKADRCLVGRPLKVVPLSATTIRREARQ
jgi:hypothetical protein